MTGNEAKTFFKVPQDWTVYEQTDVFQALSPNPSPAQIEQLELTRWARGFDADPDPSNTHILNPTTDHPWGFASVRELNEEEREAVSLTTLENAVFRVDALEEQDATAVNELETEDIVLEDGTHGRRVVYDVKLPGAPATMTFSQTALVDPPTEHLYLFVVGCSAGCYRRNQEAIEEVVGSWTIKES